MDAPTPYRLTEDEQDAIVRNAAHAAGRLPARDRDAAVALALDLYATAAEHGHSPAALDAVSAIPAAAAQVTAARLVAAAGR
ncbi:hypothetical protein [Phytomonospora endophytica]|uniref:Uncharacterized protein n=1 Tax=Phytomonospora endophytica TaxID=714109 RepID=A0A841FXA6_9ACTN|nr:hypothetical protein [Phytomonospora endophytica]MBB6039373.1 hypothetical protein [Phytomonospora endophytica]